MADSMRVEVQAEVHPDRMQLFMFAPVMPDCLFTSGPVAVSFIAAASSPFLHRRQGTLLLGA